MMKFLVAILLFVLSLTSFADLTEVPTKEIVSAVKQYANKVGCFISMDENNIVKSEIKGSPYFIVLYHIDTGCTTGNNMHRPAFAALSTDKNGKVFVVKKYSDPKLTPESFIQNLDRIYIKNNNLWYTAKEYNWGAGEKNPAKIDAICCPSLEVDGEFYFGKDGWVDARVKREEASPTQRSSGTPNGAP